MTNQKIDKLIRACKIGDIEKVKYLVDHGAGIHADNEYALRWSASRGHLGVVKYLVEQGADIHAINNASLRLAANNSHLEVVNYLVEHGADVHVDNDYILRFVAKRGYLEMVNYLREVVGNKWKCYNCIVRITCLKLCEDWNKNV